MQCDVGSCLRQALNHPWLREQGVASDKPMDSVVITRIQQFAANSRFKKAAISVMASCLTPAELSGLEHLFQSIDADGNGTITAAELKQALQSMGSKIPDQELQVAGQPRGGMRSARTAAQTCWTAHLHTWSLC
jgi:EF-hand domain